MASHLDQGTININMSPAQLNRDTIIRVRIYIRAQAMRSKLPSNRGANGYNEFRRNKPSISIQPIGNVTLANRDNAWINRIDGLGQSSLAAIAKINRRLKSCFHTATIKQLFLVCNRNYNNCVLTLLKQTF